LHPNLHITEILLVEDNPGDARLVVEALKEDGVAKHLTVVQDGAAALEFLRGQGKCRDAERPDLVLLDLNLPGKNGRQVLCEMKGDPDLRRIPVVILTTSNAEADILESYDLHANCYIVKPVDLPQFLRVVRGIEDFWFSIVKLPSRPEAHG
jgi:chemotaxis family two-component system response regulator Rcp1